MNFRLFNRRVLAAGLVLTAIFITISTASIVSGAEPDQAETEQRSRLNPKRIFSGLKRGVSKLCGRDQEEATPAPELPRAPLPVVSRQIDQQRIAHETARRTQDPFLPPRPAGAIASKSTIPRKLVANRHLLSAAANRIRYSMVKIATVKTSVQKRIVRAFCDSPGSVSIEKVTRESTISS